MLIAARVLALIALSLIFGVSCVSVRLAENEIKKAEGVRFSAPNGDFVAFTPDHLDAAWKNSKNGNSISFLSDCDEKSDPSLTSVQQGILNGLAKQEVVDSSYKPFNGRQALFTRVKGEVDGIPSQVQMVILKKNKCLYVITYVGLEAQFESNRADFENFVQGFRAP
ncbi:MAG: hypothetical protein IT288_01145 [Bdellovibrionales bacterium]|nr:hypothetical protein [Bdellovibrionales bacterium]